MGSFSIWHWLLVLLIIVLVFGSRKLKDLGKDLGEAVRNFKHAVNDDKKSENTDKLDEKNPNDTLTKKDDEITK